MPHPDQLHAVLWDLDGTLLDSREYHWLSWREALAAEGITLSRAQFDATVRPAQRHHPPRVAGTRST